MASGSVDNKNANRLRGKKISTVAPTNGQVQIFNSGTDEYAPGTITGNATHTGEVTGATALTVDKTAITNKTLVTLDSLDHILIADASDSDNLKKVLASDFGQSGKVAIYDANGKPTFYATLQDAVAVGGLIHIFANITTTSTINMVQGTSINLNGFTITMSNDDATNLITFVGDAGGYTGKPFFNGKLLRTGRANNSTGAVIGLNNAGGSINYFFNFEGVEIVNTYGKGVVALNTGLTFQFENIKVNSYNTCLDLNSAGIGGWIKKANLSSIVAWAVSKSGAVINVYQSILFSVSEYAVFGSVDTYGCTLESATWVVVAGGSHYNGTIRTGSFYAASGASLYQCTVSSTLNYGVFQCPVVEDCYVTSVTSNACYSSVIGAVIVGGTLTSLGAASTINSAASVNSKFTNVTIQNKGTGHGVDGGNTDSVYKNCNFIIADGTKNAISTGTTPRWMQCNFSANLTNPTGALVNAQVNTADNYGNIQEG